MHVQKKQWRDDALTVFSTDAATNARVVVNITASEDSAVNVIASATATDAAMPVSGITTSSSTEEEAAEHEA